MGCFKASETLLGIETLHRQPMLITVLSFKASETLLGIETCRTVQCHHRTQSASKPLKPF